MSPPLFPTPPPISPPFPPLISFLPLPISLSYPVVLCHGWCILVNAAFCPNLGTPSVLPFLPPVWRAALQYSLSSLLFFLVFPLDETWNRNTNTWVIKFSDQIKSHKTKIDMDMLCSRNNIHVRSVMLVRGHKPPYG